MSDERCRCGHNGSRHMDAPVPTGMCIEDGCGCERYDAQGFAMLKEKASALLRAIDDAPDLQHVSEDMLNAIDSLRRLM